VPAGPQVILRACERMPIPSPSRTRERARVRVKLVAGFPHLGEDHNL